MKISVEEDASAPDALAVERGLIAHADANGIEPRNYRSLAIMLRDDAGAVTGGLIGATVWGWLHVKELWVAEQCRGRHWGAKLMALAEEEAIARRCHHAFLDTFDFQALGFYERLGYTVYGTLNDFPRGHVRYFVSKRLGGAS